MLLSTTFSLENCVSSVGSKQQLFWHVNNETFYQHDILGGFFSHRARKPRQEKSHRRSSLKILMSTEEKFLFTDSAGQGVGSLNTRRPQRRQMYLTWVSHTRQYPISWMEGARAQKSYNFISRFKPFSWLVGFESTWYLELGSSELPKITFHFSFRVIKIWRFRCFRITQYFSKRRNVARMIKKTIKVSKLILQIQVGGGLVQLIRPS